MDDGRKSRRKKGKESKKSRRAEENELRGSHMAQHDRKLVKFSALRRQEFLNQAQVINTTSPGTEKKGAGWR